MQTQLLTVQEVPKADISHIAIAVDNAACQHLDKQWKETLVNLGTDGAVAILGKNNGVVTKLKKDHLHVISVYCMNHRMELTFKDVAKKNPCHKRLVYELFLGLYLSYHHSSLNRANLKNSFLTLDKTCLILT